MNGNHLKYHLESLSNETIIVVKWKRMKMWTIPSQEKVKERQGIHEENCNIEMNWSLGIKFKGNDNDIELSWEAYKAWIYLLIGG